MTRLGKRVTAAAFGAALLVFPGAASARIPCSAHSDCRRSHGYWYITPGVDVTPRAHGASWSNSDRYRWRGHGGLGFWDHGHWRSID